MTARTLAHPVHGAIEVRDGPALFAGLATGPGLEAHARRYGGTLPRVRLEELVALTNHVALHGRGGAGFPFARKLATTATGRGRPVVVVNLSEGEPDSHKDAVLARVAPHLVLDGAAVTAAALGAREVHVVLPSAVAAVTHGVRAAVDERRDRSAARDRRLRWVLHEAADLFVAGQSSAVLELLAGRPNLPVTTWRPSAESGLRGRPTLLSNAETFAQVARVALLGAAGYRRHGTVAEPGTTLLTVTGRRFPVVVETELGAPWSSVLDPDQLAAPVLLGGYHGTWVPAGALTALTVSPAALSGAGLDLGAGVVLPLLHGCPVDRTGQLVDYLASQSAGRCGPCFNGLPALAAALSAVRCGQGGMAEVRRLCRLVDGRGACAHPDGTVRLVRSLVAAFPHELDHHARGDCGFVSAPHVTLRQVPA